MNKTHHTILLIRDISFAYGGHHVLNNLSMEVTRGEIVTILGSSGSGKTTLFRLITGLEKPKEGQIIIDGLPLPYACQCVSYMMQDDLLLPWRTVLANVTLLGELQPMGESTIDLHKRAEKLLEEVGLKGSEKLYPRELSGGMRQRVALARCLLQNRPLLLLDEPFGALDGSSREMMYELLIQVQQSYGKTIVLVTHDLNDARALSQKIYTLDKGNLEAIENLDALVDSRNSAKSRSFAKK